MGTSTKRVSKNKTRRVLDLSGKGPAVKTVKPRCRNRKVRSIAARSEFKLIHSLQPDDQRALDKLRDDLQDSIERVVRVQNRFVDELNKHAVKSNRTKTIVKAIGEIPFHADYQRRIVNQGITEILKSAEVEAQRKREEKKKQKAKDQVENCFACYTIQNY